MPSSLRLSRADTGQLSAQPGQFNMLGLPSLSLPCGFDAAGLPVGFQLAGPPHAEAALLALGMAYEDAAGWYRRVPGG